MRVVFFDGYCNLCNGFVSWLIGADRKGAIKVASLQGETAKKMLAGFSLDLADPETVVYFRDVEVFVRSTAVLTILRDIGGFWWFAGLLFCIPESLRDLAYKMIAKNRYRLFGQRKTCRIPTTAELSRFLP